ncbi:MAG: helix-hairpin-helix domain-containing protein [Alphaproteobacteria bacterium]|uniref:Helix-hairpin-helix domain-containing protein n=1 Tax=Candidatus Nitrobium versatile TaxID=2884831 RepID=A0A953M1E8_9BACT|nr:helix-hairpin-helix domain-containing protein [Candidatus Nitrobium versatile]
MTYNRIEGKTFDLNESTMDDLVDIPNVGREGARQIINYRNEHGPFTSWADLDRIPGISKAAIAELKKRGATIREDGGGETPEAAADRTLRGQQRQKKPRKESGSSLPEAH